jgi:hypothetical protein
MFPDCTNPSWGIDFTEHENIFQLCRVLTLVFADCSIVDQHTANLTCSHSQLTDTGVGSISPLVSDSSSSSCAEECVDRTAAWCQYSAIYLVFCDPPEGSIPPGTTLEERQSMVQDYAADCNGTARGGGEQEEEEEDDGSVISSGSDGSVGGALSALLGE